MHAPPSMTSTGLNPIPSVRALHVTIEEPLDSFIRILSKLPNTSELFIGRRGELSPDGFTKLWNNLAILSQLRQLTFNMPLTFPYAELKPLTSVNFLHDSNSDEESYPDSFLNVFANLPNVQEIIFTNSIACNIMHMKETHEIFRKFWRMLHSFTNLTRLTLAPPKFVPHGLEPLTQIQYLDTAVRNELERLSFVELLSRFPAVQELILFIGNSSDTKLNARFHDIFLSTFVDSVMINNLSLKLINLTFNSDKHQEETILHDTVAKFINMLKSSPEIQDVNIFDIHKSVFKDLELLEIVKSVRSIPSIFHLGISHVFSLKGELYHYVSQNSIPEDIVSAMELSEQRKSFIKLTLERSGDPYMANTISDDVWFLRRL